MRKFLSLITILVISMSATFGAKFPEDVKAYIQREIPQADIRFDGVITLPDNTVYLPLYPSLFSDIKKLEIMETYPSGRVLQQRPDIVIFNNDFVLMRVISDNSGHKTVLHQTEPPLQVRTGLLPQDMLVPSGLIVPENIKGIIGNLKIDTKGEDIIKVNNEDSYEEFLSKKEADKRQSIVPELSGKVLYVTTNYSKNIQVVDPDHSAPKYSLSQKSIPVDAKVVNNGKFLMVTTYERPFVDIISIADSRFIKQIPLDSNPEQIVIDEANNKAYVTSPSASMIYAIDLDTMSLIQKIKVNGYCERLVLSGNKMLYVDKLKNEIWAIELDNDYLLKDIGSFPNISAIGYANNRIFLASRTKSRIAVIDYDSMALLKEFTTVSKPVSISSIGNMIYILGAENNEIQIIDAGSLEIAGTIALNTYGFSTGLNKVYGEDLYVVTDLKKNMYSIVDLKGRRLIKTYSLNIPLKDVIIAKSVKAFD